MRDDKLAKLYFHVGCLGLPWLWGVHILNVIGKNRRARLEGLNDENNNNNNTTTNRSDDDDDDDDRAAVASGLLSGESIVLNEEEGPADPAEMDLEEKKWVRREFVGLVLVLMAWLTWIIVFQVLREYFPPGWLVRGQSEAEATGW